MREAFGIRNQNGRAEPLFLGAALPDDTAAAAVDTIIPKLENFN